MSDAVRPSREWLLYVHDMIKFGERVLSYTEGMDQDSFVADSLTYDATLRNLTLIGEAATHVPDDVRDAHPEIPWRAIIGARNRIMHGYLGIDNHTVWTMIEDAMPTLLPALRRIADT